MAQPDDGERRMLLIPFAPGIGDMVMLEPLIRAVRAASPGWELTVVAMEYASDILPPGDYKLATSSYFTSKAPTSLRPLHRLVPQQVIAWAAAPAIESDLGRFDRVLNLFLAWETRTPFDEWWTPRWPLLPAVKHTVDLLADYLEEELEITISPESRVPRLTPTPEGEDWAHGYLAGFGDTRPAVALIVSGENALKLWSVDGWVEVVDRLVSEGWRPLIVAPHGNPHAFQVYEACNVKPEWPEMTIRQMVALLANCKAAIGVDTGPLHVAAAVGVPWVGLYGATNPDMTAPYDRSRGVALLARLPKPESCKDCWLAFKNRKDDCLTLPATGCTILISVAEVMEAFRSVSSGTMVATGREGGIRGDRSVVVDEDAA